MKSLFTFIVLVVACVLGAGSYAASVLPSFIEADLNEAEIAHLLYMREEEKLARDVYTYFDDKWAKRVFSNISVSEQKHMDAVLQLLVAYGLEDPVTDDTAGSFTNPVLAAQYLDFIAGGEVSLLDAMYVGAYIEEQDIQDLQIAISETTQPDIVLVYENLLAGSKNHLRAFVHHVLLQEDEYIAQVLTQAEVDEILGEDHPGQFRINAGMNDAWYYPGTDGQGFFITVLPNLELISLGWFTFDVEPVTGEASHRWLTAAGPYAGDEAQLDLTVTTGGVFDTAQPAPSSSLSGTILLRFEDCNSGTVSYDIPSINRSGLIPIQRVATDNVALCEALSDIAD